MQSVQMVQCIRKGCSWVLTRTDGEDVQRKSHLQEENDYCKEEV